MREQPPPTFYPEKDMTSEICQKLFIKAATEKNPEQREAYEQRLDLEWQRLLDAIQSELEE